MQRRSLVKAIAALPPLVVAHAQAHVDASVSNVMVVLRETWGRPPKPVESLVHLGPAKVELSSGNTIEVDTADFAYLADMQVRFVFDGERSMQNLSYSEFMRLGMPAEDALKLAISNIRRVYGPPRAIPWVSGLMEVESKSPDLISSYFLDKQFWGELELKHPEGIVAVVPKRGGLSFTPHSNTAGVEMLRQRVVYLHRSSERLRISSGVYLFKGGGWSILQQPVPVQREA